MACISLDFRSGNVRVIAHPDNRRNAENLRCFVQDRLKVEEAVRDMNQFIVPPFLHVIITGVKSFGRFIREIFLVNLQYPLSRSPPFSAFIPLFSFCLNLFVFSLRTQRTRAGFLRKLNT